MGYAALLQVNGPVARAWYEQEAAQQTWSVRTLQRNISSQYYYRMLKTQKQAPAEQEMQEKTSAYQNDKLEFIKNPLVAKFLGLSSNTDFTESDLEKSIAAPSAMRRKRIFSRPPAAERSRQNLILRSRSPRNRRLRNPATRSLRTPPSQAPRTPVTRHPRSRLPNRHGCGGGCGTPWRDTETVKSPLAEGY